jgi:hypothetical protein
MIMAKYLSQSKLLAIEKNAMIVESEIFENLLFAVEREGKGMLIIYGKYRLPLAAEYMKEFFKEADKVWEHMKPRTVG